MDHGDHGGGGSSGNSTNTTMDHSMMGMSMSFHFGTSETILFEFWKTSDVASLLGSCILIFLLAITYEALKFFRDHIQQNYVRSITAISTTPISHTDESAPIENESHVDRNVVKTTMFSTNHSAQTLLHVLQFVLSYFLMLIFMTYNVWLCLAVALGAGVGYFLFGWQRSVIIDPTEHCS